MVWLMPVIAIFFISYVLVMLGVVYMCYLVLLNT